MLHRANRSHDRLVRRPAHPSLPACAPTVASLLPSKGRPFPWCPALPSATLSRPRSLCHPPPLGQRHMCLSSISSTSSLYLQPLMLVCYFSASLTVNFLKKWSMHPHTTTCLASPSSNPPGSWLPLTTELAQVRATSSCHAAQVQAAPRQRRTRCPSPPPWDTTPSVSPIPPPSSPSLTGHSSFIFSAGCFSLMPPKRWLLPAPKPSSALPYPLSVMISPCLSAVRPLLNSRCI